MISTVSTIFELLPKTDCRKCTYATCCAFATELAHGRAPLSGCPALADEAKTILAQIMIERQSAATTAIWPKNAEEVRGFLSVGKKAVLLPLQVISVLMATFPLSVPMWLFMVWLFLR